MAGYTRVDTSNNIADGNIIAAADLDNEFDGVQAAFSASTGHTHGGAVGEGAPIVKLGPTNDVTISATLLAPKTTNTVDIGGSSLKYKDLWLAGNASIAGTLAVTGVATLTAQPVLSSLTASSAVATDASKGLVSVTNTGTGNNVLATSPTLVTPALGTPASGVVTNLTGTASININGTVGATTASTGAFTTLAASGVTTVQAGTAALPAITTAGDTNTGIFFPAADSVATTVGGVEGTRLTSTGLGIGTSDTSTGRVNVQAGASATGNSLFLSNFDGTYNPFLQIQHNGVDGIRLFTSSSYGGTAGNFTINPINSTIFQSGGSELARINSNGELSIGKTQASESYTTGNGYGFALPTVDPFFSVVNVAAAGVNSCIYLNKRNSNATNGLIMFQSNNGSSQVTVGSITHNGTNTSYNTSSDYRLKENIQPMTGALAKVATLKPVTYTWKADGSSGEGFIAHELQEVCPSAVIGEKDGEEMQGVDYGKLTPILTAALQEAITKIKTLEARIAVLEAK